MFMYIICSFVQWSFLYFLKILNNNYKNQFLPFDIKSKDDEIKIGSHGVSYLLSEWKEGKINKKFSCFSCMNLNLF